MNTIESLTLEVGDPQAADRFYASAFGPDLPVRLQGSDEPTTGFRGFTISLIVSQPSIVSTLIDAAVDAGATTLKSVSTSMWGVGGVVQAPDGAVWKVATSAKKDTEPASVGIDRIVLLLGAENVGESKRFYADHGLTVGKSFGGYVDFAMPSSPVGLGLYKRKALAKDAGTAPEGTGSHRLVIGGNAGAFTDPDGFVWA